MNYEFFIAKRMYRDKNGERKISLPAIRIAIVSIALGLAVMILSVAIVIGFKEEVRNKVIGFGSHIQITNFDSNNTYETQPIVVNDTLIKEIAKNPNVAYIQKFATKPGIIKTDEDFLGVIFKGVDENYDWAFFRQNLVEGDVLEITSGVTSDQVLISKTIADKLHLKLGDTFVTCFVQNETPRLRKYKIVGIYQTHFADYDQLFIFSDIKQIRRLNEWEPDMVSGLEILVKNYNQLDETSLQLYYDLQSRNDRLGNTFYTRSIKQLNPMIFAWLDVLNLNVVVILLLMLVVAGFSMISGLLILILERANLIGILKALGETNINIRKIFLYFSLFLIGKGLLWGNLIALAICLIQKYFGIFKLDPDTYYVSEVPVHLTVASVVLINIGALLITLLMLVGPSYLVAKISPAKTIRFE
ncbi:MAG: ABC transporter permease [Dysgonamonadaceae bacterium]|jgi:lipoprotein-releasing system permease protein|nr:ABC transporter permease [Dysgonamonadaceae bacterium]